jgi:hypothetical protein
MEIQKINMKRFNCFLIVGGDLKEVTIEADTVHPDSTCATRFHKSVKRLGLYGTPENVYELVAQYPSDKLIIESVEDLPID